MLRNLEDAFSNAIVSYENIGGHETNWSRSVCDGLAQHNFDEVPFRVPQLLEPSALAEVASRHGMGVNELEFLSYEVRGPAVKLKWLIDMLEWAPPVQKLSLAQCLASTCRYRFAKKVMEEIPYGALYPNQKITYHLTQFAINNRLEVLGACQNEFVLMKSLLEAHRVSAARVLDVCAQAIVWKIKGDIIDHDLGQWFISAGEQAAKKISSSVEYNDLISLSSYYRALAMVPAAMHDARTTRKYMLLAEEFAEAALCSENNLTIAGREARKTVYESKLKEMLYVACDINSARQVAEELIEYDANWSISYHEAGEVEIIAREWARALDFYQAAYDIGFPRVTYSQFMIGTCQQQLKRYDLALAAFKNTLILDPSNISAGIAGHAIARQHLPEILPFFDSYIEGWKGESALTEKQLELIYG